MGVTAFAGLCCTLLAFFFEPQAESAEFWHVLGVLQITLIDLDLSVNLFCCLEINNSWQPRFFRAWRAAMRLRMSSRSYFKRSTVVPITRNPVPSPPVL